MKFKKVEIVIPIQDMKYRMKNLLDAYLCIKGYAYIIHNEDFCKKHMHVLVEFWKPMDFDEILIMFNVNEKFIRSAECSTVITLLYMLNRCDVGSNYHQYGIEELEYSDSFRKYINELEHITTY